jgi:Flp pilus assembly pilin Flp
MNSRLSRCLSLAFPRLEDLAGERGQTTVEYAVVTGMIIVLTVSVFVVLSNAAAAFMENAAAAIANVLLP